MQMEGAIARADDMLTLLEEASGGPRHAGAPPV
jgi:hypothetical protein